MNEEQVPEKEQKKISKKKCTDWIINKFKGNNLKEKSLSIIAILISIIALVQTCEANKIAEDANKIAKRAYFGSYESQNIITLREIITKIQDIYSENNGQNISTEDKQTLKTISNSVETILNINYHDSSPKFVLVKEKAETLKKMILHYLYRMAPELEPAVAIDKAAGGELPNTGALPNLELAFLDYKNILMDYLSNDNN